MKTLPPASSLPFTSTSYAFGPRARRPRPLRADRRPESARAGSVGAFWTDLQFFLDARPGRCDNSVVFIQDCAQQNGTTEAGAPSFARLLPSDSGIDLYPLGSPEEGLLLVDLDMDGDLDVLRNPGGSLSINPCRGDGTYLPMFSGLASSEGWGVSAADWDNDGDLDITAGGNWFRNDRVEGWSYSQFPSYPIVGILTKVHRSQPTLWEPWSALPSWADVDLDGDLDCARSVFSHGSSWLPLLFRNALYFAACDEPKRRYLSIRPVRAVDDPNGPGLPNGRNWTDNELGAKVEVVIRGDTSGLRRVQFTSSAGGYLNQNEYPLNVGLPPHPDPNNPRNDLELSVFVDFVKPLPEGDAAEGPWRIDWTINPALSDINLATLYPDPNDPNTLGRPISVYRDGRVQYAGQTYDPVDPNTGDPNVGVSPARMYTVGGPLLLPEPRGGPLPTPTVDDVFAGIQLTKEPNTPAVRVREIIVEGQLETRTAKDCDFNIVLLDVTDPSRPILMGGLKSATVAHNRRTFIPIMEDPRDPDTFILPEDVTERKYQVRAALTEYRPKLLEQENALEGLLGITLDGGLELSRPGDLCTDVIEVQSGKTTESPVTVRLSRKAQARR